MLPLYELSGPMALGSRLRLLSEWITRDAARVYESYGLDFEPRWFSVFFALANDPGKSVMELAEFIGQTHVSISQIVTALMKKGWLETKIDAADKRVKRLYLTATGQEVFEQMKPMTKDVDTAIRTLLSHLHRDLWGALDELERGLLDKDFFTRVKDLRLAEDQANIRIVDYAPQYRDAFSQLNYEWIQRYFEIEEPDRKALDNPESYILDKGGKILIALIKEEPLGACALIKKDEKTYELGKMAVSPKAQGKGLGLLLGQAVIQKAKDLGATRLYLESNTKLIPAINLYYKLGFHKVEGYASLYARCNISMEMAI
jgi:DNA-binding MarR family transcriptional regulator/N-acetylglutamate synthase-like GNAT family acetyltransferase